MERLSANDQLSSMDFTNKPLEELDPTIEAEKRERMERLIHMNDVWVNGEWCQL